MLVKVISGGQTGADYAGLLAAKICNIPTGGTGTKGYLTEDGPSSELGEKFYLKEHSSPQYPPRTAANVVDSDATLRLAVDFSTAGEKCTLRNIKAAKKPYFDIKFDRQHIKSFMEGDQAKREEILHHYIPVILEVSKWIKSNNIQVLNVAGNRESTCPGLCEFLTNFLFFVFIREKTWLN